MQIRTARYEWEEAAIPCAELDKHKQRQNQVLNTPVIETEMVRALSSAEKRRQSIGGEDGNYLQRVR